VTAEFAAESLRSTATVLEWASVEPERRPELPAKKWVEADSIRETTLICLEKRRDCGFRRSRPPVPIEAGHPVGA
jgi:hypothetical protein